MRGPDHTHTNTPTTAGDGSVHHVTNTQTPTGIDSRMAEQIRKDAYKAGVVDERAKHKRNPLLSILIALAAVLGLAVLVLWAMNGFSFTRSGEVLDRAADRGAEQAAAASREVADEAGEGMQDAGRTLEQRGEQAQPAAPPASSAQPAPAT